MGISARNLLKSVDSAESFENNMTGSEAFDNIKKTATQRIINNIKKAGSITKLYELDEVVTPQLPALISPASRSPIGSKSVS